MREVSAVEKKMLTHLQRGIEITSRPFQGLELPEDAVLDLLKRASEEGLLRRFGGIFDARRLGYKSVLCALDCCLKQMEQQAAIIVEHPGVTHCYERRLLHGTETYPPLWFTLAMLHDEFDAGISSLRSQLATPNSKLQTRSTRPPKAEAVAKRGNEVANSQLFELPALRRFKIDVVFDLQTRNRDEVFPGITPAAAPAFDESFRTFSLEEKNLVRALDQEIPLVARPFAALADQLGQTEERILANLNKWKEQGVLRRIGAVLYHREAGFTANAMCVWPVDGDIAAAGRRVAARSEVTHCYQRPRLEVFPFDLYAMIHSSSWEQAEELFKTISAACDLTGGQLLASAREFKKSSMKYFREE